MYGISVAGIVVAAALFTCGALKIAEAVAGVMKCRKRREGGENEKIVMPEMP